jgi:signal transduction histidine kinase
MVEGTGLVFEARAEPAVMSAVVVADRDRLDQIVLVLVDNAVNHSPAGGTVTLALTAAQAHRSALVTVSDQGPGIPPDQRERIFEPFARLRGPGSIRRDRGPTDRGSGLGLAIARQLAARQGATLAAIDAPVGTGAVLRLTLPLAPSGSQARTTAESGPAA